MTGMLLSSPYRSTEINSKQGVTGIGVVSFLAGRVLCQDQEYTDAGRITPCAQNE